MELYRKISEVNRTKYGTEFERVLKIIINQYSDRTHFIYEILQNAEDAGATYIKFKLNADNLTIHHNGRPFNENDIDGVCGIASGTKEDGTRIGHFGIGFKSVYCYTETPFIYSGQYHFKIKNQLFPEEVTRIDGVDYEETCMILPFNKESVSKQIAYNEIADALQKKITAESIIMLNQIENIQIQIIGSPEEIHISKQKYSLDKQYPENVFGLSMQTTIVNVQNGKERIKDADYLFFTDANEEAAAIVFKVEGKELTEIRNSKIYAFFPTAKEAHQNFYIHAPFDTTPARDNFKEGAEYGKHNIQLVKNIGELIWFAFVWMKDYGYLSVSGFNKVFPIYEYEEDDLLYDIYQNSIDIINEEVMLPTNYPNEFKRIRDVYVPLWGVIVDTFDDSDLKALTGNHNVSWLAKEISTESYVGLRTFLKTNFNLQTLDWKDLVSKLDATFLEKKNIVWLEKLFSRIESYCIKRATNDSHYIDVSSIPFVRVANGKHILPRDKSGHLLVYMNNPEMADFRIESNFQRSDAVRSFYQRVLKIPDYNIEQEALENILPKYASKAVRFKTDSPIRENIADLKIIKDALYTNPSIVEKLAEAYIVTDGNAWYKPSELYMRSNDVRAGYALVKEFLDFRFLTESYFDDTVLSIKLDEEFFKKIGCNYGLKIVRASRESYLKTVKKYQGIEQEKDLNRKIFSKSYISKKIDWSFYYEGFPEVFRNMTKERSIQIARFLNPNAMDFDVSGELVGADDLQFSGKNVDSAMAYSMLGMMLSFEKWIYIEGDDTPYRPFEVDKEDILSEYKVAGRLLSVLPFKEVKSPFINWLEEHIESKTEIDQIKHYFSKPEDVVKIMKAMARSEAKEEARKEKAKGIRELIEKGDRSQKEGNTHYPEIEVTPISEKGKKKREENLDKALAESLDNFTRVARGLQFSSRTCNKQERLFLEQEYNGVCQICKEQIVKHTGKPYFEAINIIKYSELPEELENSSQYGWNSLCLCPNCAAKYNYASKKISSIYDQVMAMDVVPGSEETIDIEIEIPEGRKRYIHYSPRHFLALKRAFKIFTKE